MPDWQEQVSIIHDTSTIVHLESFSIIIIIIIIIILSRTAAWGQILAMELEIN
jgi:hypothetical protein